jgi:hypothetical protein
MESQHRQLRQRTEARSETEATLDAAQAAHTVRTETFETPEALIAFDRDRTPVPDSLHRRVAEAVVSETGKEPPATVPWWRRLF